MSSISISGHELVFRSFACLGVLLDLEPFRVRSMPFPSSVLTHLAAPKFSLYCSNNSVSIHATLFLVFYFETILLRHHDCFCDSGVSFETDASHLIVIAERFFTEFLVIQRHLNLRIFVLLVDQTFYNFRSAPFIRSKFLLSAIFCYTWFSNCSF